MKLLYKKALVFVAAGLVYLAGQYFRGVWFLHSPINVCGNFSDQFGPFCNSPFINTLGWPLIVAGEMLAIVAAALLFANEESFRKWLKFSYFYVPIVAAIVIFVFPVAMPLGAQLPREGAVHAFGLLYAIVTLAIVLWVKIKRRRWLV